MSMPPQCSTYGSINETTHIIRLYPRFHPFRRRWTYTPTTVEQTASITPNSKPLKTWRPMRPSGTQAIAWKRKRLNVKDMAPSALTLFTRQNLVLKMNRTSAQFI